MCPVDTKVIPHEERFFGKIFRSFLIPGAGTYMPLNADKQVEGRRNLHIGTQINLNVSGKV